MGDLLERWLALHPAADPAFAQAAGDRLVQRYSEPHRRYHDVRHLSEVLDGIAELAHHATDPDAVRLAAWLHDAVYDPAAQPGANEAASAALTAAVLGPLGQGGAERLHEVARLVLLTATHVTTADDADGQVLCDADLRVLAAEPTRCREYAADVRAEYAAVPDPAFRTGRTAVLGRLLHREHVYATPTARERWESPARANLTDELARLREGPQ